MARLHTFPLTLGGMPCHHRSLTRRDVHLWGQSEEGQGHPGGQGGKRSTPCCSHRAPIGQDVLIPGLDGGADALFELTAILELLLPLLSLLQLCNHPFRCVKQAGRTDGRFPTKVRSLPLFLACATISSYCCLCFCASSAGFAGRLLQQRMRIKTTAYFDFLLHGDGPTGSGQ